MEYPQTSQTSNQLMIPPAKPRPSLFLQYILQRIEQNKNFLAGIVGSTGSGKSYSALYLGEKLDPNFDVRNVVFTARQFLDLINGKVKPLDKGSVIVCDEMGIIAGNKTWLSQTNRLIHYLLQTFRHKNFILFMCVPHFSFIDASVRKLFHCVAETVSISLSTKQTTVRPKLIQVNSQTGKAYYKYLRVLNNDGLVPLRIIRTKLPSKNLLIDYETKKTDFTRDLNIRIDGNIQNLDNKEMKQVNQVIHNGYRELTNRQAQCLKYFKLKMSVKEVAKKMNISAASVYPMMRALIRKGYEMTPIRKGEGKNGFKSVIKYYEINPLS